MVVLTGAGVSAESGIPTFRDALSGLWARFDPEDLATPEAFERDPRLVTEWYDQRRQNCMRVKPNRAHVALARLQREMNAAGRAFRLLTQNVDRLHQAAGSCDVVELHGSIMEWRCVSCGESRERREPSLAPYPSRCGCGGLLRPDVVWFGEVLPESAVRLACLALEQCDLFISVGTSAVVYPVAGFAHLAKSASARTLEINLEPTPISATVDWLVLGQAGCRLPTLLQAAMGGEPW